MRHTTKRLATCARGFLALVTLLFFTILFFERYASVPFKARRVGLYEDVRRREDGSLIMAFYFPQYHYAPENLMQFRAYGLPENVTDWYTDWDVLKSGDKTTRSITPKKYYNLADPSALDEHDRAAHTYGVGVFIFYHYWLDNSMILNLPVDLFIRKRRSTKFILCWDNESGFLGKQLYDHPEKHAYQLVRYFSSENYLTDVHGRKPFIIYLTPDLDMEYLSSFLAYLKKFGIILTIGHNYQAYKNDWQLPEWSDIASEFAPHFDDGPTRENLYDYPVRDPSSESLTWSENKQYWQGAITSWDSRPRCSSGRTHQNRTGCAGLVSPVGFGKMLRQIEANFHPHNKDKVITVFAWNEWAEGAALEESLEYGSKFLEQL